MLFKNIKIKLTLMKKHLSQISARKTNSHRSPSVFHQTSV